MRSPGWPSYPETLPPMKIPNNDIVDVWTKVNNLKSKKDGKAERNKDMYRHRDK